jgi:hypothetical protein
MNPDERAFLERIRDEGRPSADPAALAYRLYTRAEIAQSEGEYTFAQTLADAAATFAVLALEARP